MQDFVRLESKQPAEKIHRNHNSHNCKLTIEKHRIEMEKTIKYDRNRVDHSNFSRCSEPGILKFLYTITTTVLKLRGTG